jgi:hypothetical protein
MPFKDGLQARQGARHLLLSGNTLQDDAQGLNHSTTLLYRACKLDCDGCPFKMRGYAKEPARKIPRSIYEDACDVARSLAKTEIFERSRHDQKRVEKLFAHRKRIPRIGRLPCADHVPSGVCARRHVSKNALAVPPLRPATSATNSASSVSPAVPLSGWLRSRRCSGMRAGIRVCPKTSGGITKFSEHEAD